MLKAKLKTSLKKLDHLLKKPLFTPDDVGATVEIIEDSYFEGKRLTTFKLTYWRAIHGEFMTHRDFSRGAGSSRAKPTKAQRHQVWHKPCGAIKWGANKAGMQAGEDLSMIEQSVCNLLHYHIFNKVAVGMSYTMEKMGVHKQWANRYLETFERIEVVVSATSYKNFFTLRCHKDAQPEIQQLAGMMREALRNSQPRTLQEGEYHLPFVTYEEREHHPVEECIIMSTARCARVSYGLFDGKPSTFEKDFDLYHKLVIAEPPHASPTEHPAQAIKGRWANFSNFRQHRWDLEMGQNLPELLKGASFKKEKPTLEAKEKYPHYYIDVTDYDFIDLYRLFRAFGTEDHEIEHSIKKLLVSGKRGAKNSVQDIKEARATLDRLIYEAEHGTLEP